LSVRPIEADRIPALRVADDQASSGLVAAGIPQGTAESEVPAVSGVQLHQGGKQDCKRRPGTGAPGNRVWPAQEHAESQECGQGEEGRGGWPDEAASASHHASGETDKNYKQRGSVRKPGAACPHGSPSRRRGRTGARQEKVEIPA